MYFIQKLFSFLKHLFSVLFKVPQFNEIKNLNKKVAFILSISLLSTLIVSVYIFQKRERIFGEYARAEEDEINLVNKETEDEGGYSSTSFQIAPIFKDNMVIQRLKPIKIYGTGKPQTTIHVYIRRSGSVKVIKSASGVVKANGRWEVIINAMAHGGPFEIDVKDVSGKITIRNVLIGDVWLCSGQSNMSMIVSSIVDSNIILEGIPNDSKLRLYRVKTDKSLKPVSNMTDVSHTSASWMIPDVNSVSNFSAVCYIYGSKISKYLDIPVGLIQASYVGTPAEAWIGANSLIKYTDASEIVSEIRSSNTFEDIDPEMRSCVDHHNSTVTSNAMISPIIPFTLRGFLWYQGESNANRAVEYQTLLSRLIADWRGRWRDPALAFVAIQLPSYNSTAILSNSWAEIRESLSKAISQKQNTAYVVTYDLNDPSTIHPKNKIPFSFKAK